MEHAVPRDLDATAALAWTWAASFLPGFLLAVVILLAGSVASGWAGRAVDGILRRAGHVDPTVRPVIAAVVRYAILVLVVVAALGQVGVQTASLLAVLGAAGLAVGLALQGTLTNIAAGIMLLWLRPFRVGEYVEVVNQPVAGTVTEIGLFASVLRTFDGVMVFAPNSALWNVSIRNHSRNEGRLVVISVQMPQQVDVERASEIIVAILKTVPGAATTPPPDVFIDAWTPAAVVFTCRLRAVHDDVGPVQRQVIDRLREGLPNAREGLAPLAITRTVPTDADPSRLIALGDVPDTLSGSRPRRLAAARAAPVAGE